jgi:hypothetical protein
MWDPQGAADRRQSPRYSVKLPAGVKIISSPMTGAFAMKSATICDLSADGVGLTIEVDTLTSRKEFAKMIVRRRNCIVTCLFPGCEQPSELHGEIMWVEPRVTSNGAWFRFGVHLDQRFPGKTDDLKAYLKTLAARHAGEAVKRIERC